MCGGGGCSDSEATFCAREDVSGSRDDDDDDDDALRGEPLIVTGMLVLLCAQHCSLSSRHCSVVRVGLLELELSRNFQV